MRSKFDNINFLISGDFNLTSHLDILDSYGALHQVVTESTRKDKILEIILTDLHTSYHKPVSLPPLQADDPGAGKDSDHNIVLFPPVLGYGTNVKREFKVITVRPLPYAQIVEAGKCISTQTWETIFDAKTPDEKVGLFHGILTKLLNDFFPEKSIKVSQFDKQDLEVLEGDP